MNRFGVLINLEIALAVVPCMDGIYQVFGELIKTALSFVATAIVEPVAGMQVFNGVNTVWFYMFKQFKKRCFNLVHRMAAIINQDINFWHFLFYLSKKIFIGL